MERTSVSRLIRDGVHGNISLTQEEMDVIDHALFQRLRDIRQTGCIHLVWPSANHTRFEHSLGVVHMAELMLNALMHESSAALAKLSPLELAEDGQAVRFDEIPADVYALIKRVTRLAALIHDLGHGPLSHNFCAFAPKGTEMNGVLNDERLSALRPFRESLVRETHAHIAHEAVSCILFTRIWREIGGEPWIPQAVTAALMNEDTAQSDIPNALRPWIPLVHDLISSAPVDADRMDYLLRDSTIGVPYGLYDPARILKAILCVNMDGSYRLGWRISSMRAIEQFVVARFFMFSQVYAHKTNRGFELMFEEIAREADAVGLTLIKSDSLDAFVESYLSLNDQSFLKTLCDLSDHPRINALANGVRTRRHWKRLYEFGHGETGTVDVILAELRARHPERAFHLDRRPLRATKDLDRGAYLMRLDARGKYTVSNECRSWIQSSPIMKTLQEEERQLTRIFVEPDDAKNDLPLLTFE